MLLSPNSPLQSHRAALIAVLAEKLNVPELEVDKYLVATRSDNKVSRGDFALPIFTFAKSRKANPAALAQELALQLNDPGVLPEHFSRTQAAGPYLNFFFARLGLIPQLIDNLRAEGGTPWPHQNIRLTLEYSSPNIAKVFHVGHLRTTLIGAALERVLKHTGHEVITINHLGDWGTQFGFVWAGVQLFGEAVRDSDGNLKADATVDDLVDLYVRASALRKAQEAGAELVSGPLVNEMARAYFLRLEAGDPEAVGFWEWCLAISLTYFKEMYKRLGISFDHYTGESFYRDMLTDVEQRIRESNILEESEGALGVDLGEALGFARIFTEDGRSLYITRDLAAAIYRHDHFGPHRSLYVVAVQQSLHFAQLKGILDRMNHPSGNEIEHVPFGMVPGMSSRAGGAISLADFLDEAQERAFEAYQNEVTKRPEGVNEEVVAEKVAIGATYFYFLSHSNTKDFQFKWEEALNFRGDSGPYLQYALSRLNSIANNAITAGIEVGDITTVDYNLVATTNEGFDLVLLLCRFDETLSRVVATNELSPLAQYVLDVAKTFSKVYLILRVLGEDQARARAHLALFAATRQVLSRGLQLLGVPLVDRM